jgi:D-3-phosphoglycerate dehydrogenase
VRPGTILVECGRGALTDNDAVLRALTDGRLSGVGLDVVDPEPPEHHPLFDHPDVVLTPNVMGLSRRATEATSPMPPGASPTCSHRTNAPGTRRGGTPMTAARLVCFRAISCFARR